MLRVLTFFFLLLSVAGCGDAKKQELSESRNFFIEANRAIGAGDSAKAIEALNASIASNPNSWAYFELARQLLEQGDQEAALSNCELALELDPQMADGLWLLAEIKKPETKRFKGRFKNPPSLGK